LRLFSSVRSTPPIWNLARCSQDLDDHDLADAVEYPEVGEHSVEVAHGSAEVAIRRRGRA
jgi:hypothetical protein